MTGSSSPTEAAAADATLAVPVWDLPVRLFHWTLVGLIAFSWWSAEYGQIEWHLWSGYGVLFLVLWRLIWGLIGSSTARFTSFVRGPRAVAGYLRRPGEWRGIGHTPLGALSVIALLGLIALQVWFGLPLSDEDGVVAGPFNRLVSFETAEWAHDMHELLFNVLLGLVALHVAAILFYRLRGKRLVGAMVGGRSRDYPAGAEPMSPATPGRLVLSLIVAGALTGWVAAGVPGL
jgi:cytochrome b